MQPEIWAEIFEHLLELGDKYTIAKAVEMQSKLPSSSNASWGFIDFQPNNVIVSQSDESSGNSEFSEQKPNLKEKTERFRSTADFSSEDYIISENGNIESFLEEVKRTTLEQTLEKIPKDTIYEYLASYEVFLTKQQKTDQKEVQHTRSILVESETQELYNFVDEFEIFSANPIKTAELIEFNANFENANLFEVFKLVSTNAYEAYLFPDYNTIIGCSNFLFHLSMRNQEDQTSKSMAQSARGQNYIEIRINNMPKVRFLNGWRCLIYLNNKWIRNENPSVNVSASRSLKDSEYYFNIFNENRNKITDKPPEKYKEQKVHFAANSLVFNIGTEYIKQGCVVSSNYPYQYSKLMLYMESLQKFNFVKIKKIGTSECFNQLPMIEIKHSSNSKELLVLCARIHAEDTSGSYALQGFIDFILGNLDKEYEDKLSELTDELAKHRFDHFLLELKLFEEVILEHFTILIFPCVNPDGAILGNSTLNSNGEDLWQVNPVALSKTQDLIINTISNYLSGTNLVFSHFINFSDTLSHAGVNIQTYESISNNKLLEHFWQLAGNSGFLPYVDSSQTLQSYINDVTISKSDADVVQMDKLVTDQQDVELYISSLGDQLMDKLNRAEGLEEFILPSLLMQASHDIMENYNISSKNISLKHYDQHNLNFMGLMKQKFNVRFPASIIIGQFYNEKTDHDISDAEYFNINDLISVGVVVATAIANEVKGNYEIHNELLQETRQLYVSWIESSLKQALLRQRSLSVMRVKDLPIPVQTLMKYKLPALALPHEKGVENKQLDALNDGIKLDFIFDLDEEMRLLSDSEVENEIIEVRTPEDVQNDRDIIKNIIQSRYPLPVKKKSKKHAKKTKKY